MRGSCCCRWFSWYIPTSPSRMRAERAQSPFSRLLVPSRSPGPCRPGEGAMGPRPSRCCCLAGSVGKCAAVVLRRSWVMPRSRRPGSKVCGSPPPRTPSPEVQYWRKTAREAANLKACSRSPCRGVLPRLGVPGSTSNASGIFCTGRISRTRSRTLCTPGACSSRVDSRTGCPKSAALPRRRSPGACRGGPPWSSSRRSSS